MAPLVTCHDQSATAPLGLPHRPVGGRRVLGLGLHRFEGHVELAMWKGSSRLLEEDDQGLALEQYWANYLSVLKGGGLPGAVKAFNGACGFGH